MKKLFISCPMRGRSEENIKKSMKKMHKIMEDTLDEKLEVIQTYIDHEVPEGVHPGMYCLGKSISLLAGADYFIGFGYYTSIIEKHKFNGCIIETEAAERYEIPTYLIMDDSMAEEILSDLKEESEEITMYAEGKPICEITKKGTMLV